MLAENIVAIVKHIPQAQRRLFQILCAYFESNCLKVKPPVLFPALILMILAREAADFCHFLGVICSVLSV